MKAPCDSSTAAPPISSQPLVHECSSLSKTVASVCSALYRQPQDGGFYEAPIWPQIMQYGQARECAIFHFSRACFNSFCPFLFLNRYFTTFHRFLTQLCHSHPLAMCCLAQEVHTRKESQWGGVPSSRCLTAGLGAGRPAEGPPTGSSAPPPPGPSAGAGCRQGH